MKKKLLLLVLGLVMMFALTSTIATAGGHIQTGELMGCYADLDGYGGDTRADAGFWIYYEETNTAVFKCLGTTYPPGYHVTLNGETQGYPYYYWEACAVDWWFGYWDGACGKPATGETYDWTIRIMPDGNWRLTAKAKDAK